MHNEPAANPLVSILMPAYNCEQFVENAVRGILAQQYENYEFIIINDGSTDATPGKILHFKDPRIKYFSNEKNRGLVATLNRGLTLCNGKYIARADADDFALPFLIKNFVDFMEQHPDHVVCGANIKVRYPRGDRVFKYPADDRKLRVYSLDACPFSSHTFIRRSILVKYNLQYLDHFYPGEDHGLWSQIMHYGKLHNLEMVSSVYNKSNDGSTTAGNYYKSAYPIARKAIFENHAKSCFLLSDKDTARYIRLHACSDRFLQVIMPRQTASASELADIGQLIVNILKQNGKSGLFDKKLLRNFFLVKWTLACYNSRIFRPAIMKTYIKWLRHMLSI